MFIETIMFLRPCQFVPIWSNMIQLDPFWSNLLWIRDIFHNCPEQEQEQQSNPKDLLEVNSRGQKTLDILALYN